MPFADRADAGRRLAERLGHLRDEPVIVLGLPRGGVPVAAEVARALHAPLDVVLVRKLGAPDRPELAMGAVGEDGALVVNDDVVAHAEVSASAFAAARDRGDEEVRRRAHELRGERERPDLAGRGVVLVDDGIATGATARAACRVVRALGARRVVLAAPVCPRTLLPLLRREADEVVCVETPDHFGAVGQRYEDFSPTEDAEVVALLRGGAGEPPCAGTGTGP